MGMKEMGMKDEENNTQDLYLNVQNVSTTL